MNENLTTSPMSSLDPKEASKILFTDPETVAQKKQEFVDYLARTEEENIACANIAEKEEKIRNASIEAQDNDPVDAKVASLKPNDSIINIQDYITETTNATVDEATEKVESVENSGDMITSEMNDQFATIASDMVENVIPSLNFIEASKLQHDINQEYNNLKQAKTIIDAVKDMPNVEETNKKILMANVLSDTEYKKDAAKFLDEYDANCSKFDKILEGLNGKIAEYDDMKKTTSFFNSQMIDSLNKKIQSAYDAGRTEEDKYVKDLKNVVDVYEHRDDLTYITKKADIDYVIKNLGKELKAKHDDVMKKTVKTLLTLFSRAQLELFEKKMYELFNDDQNASNLFLYHLSKIVNGEKKTGNFNWPRALIMNVIDIEGKIYDLTTSAEDYYKQISNLYPKYKKCLPDHMTK